LLHSVFAWHLEDMATAKRTPKVSRITRDRTVAYARKQNPSSDGARGDASAADDPASAPAENNPEDSLVTEDRPATPHPPEAFAASPAAPATAPAVAGDLPGASVEPGLEPTLPVEPGEPERARTTTVAMPPQASIGAPPGMPAGTAPIEAPVNIGSAEDPTQMPGPREIPGGNPDDPAAPPGHVPRGDSRSMRRRTDQHEFALIYRVQTYVISRFGVVGTRGQWRVVEYPTSAAAGHAYAKECSRFVSEGFSDYRA
jgi:predicted DNA-binding WGR domain protein